MEILEFGHQVVDLKLCTGLYDFLSGQRNFQHFRFQLLYFQSLFPASFKPFLWIPWIWYYFLHGAGAPSSLVFSCKKKKKKSKRLRFFPVFSTHKPSHCFLEINICKLILKLLMARIRAIGMRFKIQGLRFKMISPTHLWEPCDIAMCSF